MTEIHFSIATTLVNCAIDLVNYSMRDHFLSDFCLKFEHHFGKKCLF